MQEETLITELQDLNPWWKDKDFKFDLYRRDYYLDKIKFTSDERLIRILIGARRVGKTSIIFSLIDDLLKAKVNPSNVVFLSGDMREIQELGLAKVISFLRNLNFQTQTGEKMYIFIDEIQEIEHWQTDIKLNYDNTNIQFTISGSVSLVLNKKTSRLTGRYQLTRVLPLSFGEYLEFKFRNKKLSQKQTRQELDIYLEKGGYPETVNRFLPNYLSEVVSSTLYRDLLDYYGIRNPAILEDILRLLADKVTTPVSANRIATDLKIDNQTAGDYLEYLQAVYLIFKLPRYASSNKKSSNFAPKYYFNDTGVLKTLGLRVKQGQLAENAVFIHLLRQQYTTEQYKLYYHVEQGQEFDFYNLENLYEVKLNEGVNFAELQKYELKGKDIRSQIHPTIVGLPEHKRIINANSLNLHYQSLQDFLH